MRLLDNISVILSQLFLRAKPYDYDLRQKVIQAIECDGLPKSKASQLVRISHNTIDLWFQRRAETGDIKPKKRNYGDAR